MHKKIIALCLVCSVLGSSTVAFAATNTNSTLNNNTSTQVTASTESLSQTLINKATPFIETTQSGFYLSKEGYSSLTPTEIKVVLTYIDASNAALKEVSKTETLSKVGNTFVQSIAKPISSVNTITPMFSYSDYMCIDYKWWGAQIYFSSRAIKDFRNNLVLGGSLGGFLLQTGNVVAAGYVGSALLFSGPLGWAMAQIDVGNGICLNCILYVPATITPA